LAIWTILHPLSFDFVASAIASDKRNDASFDNRN
jgi:hypothetical protein